MSGYETVLYPFGEGKSSALKMFKNIDMSNVDNVFGQTEAFTNTLQRDLSIQNTCTSANEARFRIYRVHKGFRKLSPTDENILSSYNESTSTNAFVESCR